MLAINQFYVCLGSFRPIIHASFSSVTYNAKYSKKISFMSLRERIDLLWESHL